MIYIYILMILAGTQRIEGLGVCSAPRTISVAFALDFLWHSDNEPMIAWIADHHPDWLCDGSSLLLFLIHAFIY